MEQYGTHLPKKRDESNINENTDRTKHTAIEKTAILNYKKEQRVFKIVTTTHCHVCRCGLSGIVQSEIGLLVFVLTDV